MQHSKNKYSFGSIVVLVTVLFSMLFLLKVVVSLIFRATNLNSMPYEIYTSLMKPNYNPGEFYFVTTSKEKIANINRGEVIVHSYPKELSSIFPSEDLAIHRIVGLPGEKIEVNNGKLIINDDVFESKFISNSQFIDTVEPLVLAENMYLALPDIIHDENVKYRFVRSENIVGVVENCIKNCLR